MKRMNKQHKMMAFLLIGILLWYAYDYKDYVTGDKVLNSITALDDQLNDLKIEKHKKLLLASRERAKKDVLLANAKYFWKTSGRVQTLTIQNALNKVSARSKVKLRSTGSPRESDVTPNIKKVQIAISMQCTMREASRFYRELDMFKPCFYWESCTIRPDTRDINKVYISGQLVTYVITKKGDKLISSNKENSK